MTDVMFHFNAPDKLGHACRLLRKAVGSGAKVVVTGEAGLLRELDAALWTFSPLEFIPHCLGNAPAAVLSASPVVLTQAARTAPHHQVLVNLGATVPEGFERFERLIEVVTVDEEDRGRGRERWAYYKDRGYAITRHDLLSKEAA
ncbi:DNA polymerase III subunit chi [Caenimonas aquaedulcis]|uniref:DNA polymerase III subunit chi n=1 Tax=Caenimonas aquaedulcis TaxID=2793270 RepID=A0A931MEV7_9BURK|nr:DNA polymerase III subunit chi [Caenimonas aquaedulcis]MBG9386987.1 DNA polymerase III subunit chi [Caenimonas aquaedulcis]